jgi:hypothetical protein
LTSLIPRFRSAATGLSIIINRGEGFAHRRKKKTTNKSASFQIIRIHPPSRRVPIPTKLPLHFGQVPFAPIECIKEFFFCRFFLHKRA